MIVTLPYSGTCVSHTSHLRVIDTGLLLLYLILLIVCAGVAFKKDITGDSTGEASYLVQVRYQY